MTSPIVALKDAIRARLLADQDVMTLLREPKIFADPPRHAAFPHIAFVTATARENGTGTDDGHIVEVGLGVWCRGGGSNEGLALAAAIAGALTAMPQDLPSHRLVNLIVLSVGPPAQKDGETWRILVRIRAVTETA